MKRPKIAISIATILFFAACSRKTERAAGPLAGGVHAGKCLRLNEPQHIRSLMPLAINELNSYHLASQIYEGLVKYDQKDLSIQPCLAERWEVSADKLSYTFYLREN